LLRKINAVIPKRNGRISGKIFIPFPSNESPIWKKTQMMNNAEYTEIAEALYEVIEDTLDNWEQPNGVALDYENASGVLTIECEDTGTQVIISRQQAAKQIWVAAKSGGFHFVYDDGLWRCTKTKETLGELLSRTCTEQSSAAVSFHHVD
jgi:CyaY protein